MRLLSLIHFYSLITIPQRLSLVLHCSFLNYSICLSCWIQVPPLGNGLVSNDDPTITLTSMLRKNF